jgi:hypothetical protein
MEEQISQQGALLERSYPEEAALHNDFEVAEDTELDPGAALAGRRPLGYE